MKVIKKNRFTKARGGSSKLLVLSCAKCGNEIVNYQKDGIGTLLRLYLDRIRGPRELLNSIESVHEKSTMPNLVCDHCSALIGVPMIYEVENRLAFRLIRGSFSKKTL